MAYIAYPMNITAITPIKIGVNEGNSSLGIEFINILIMNDTTEKSITANVIKKT